MEARGQEGLEGVGGGQFIHQKALGFLLFEGMVVILELSSIQVVLSNTF